jgi:hypothetical protein
MHNLEACLMSETVESLVTYCRENDRVCPLPPLWNRLWEMLPDRSRIGVDWQPPPPLILAAWHHTPAMLKMLRLADHIEWAAKHEALEPIGKFLRELPEQDWYHTGD